MLGRSSLWGVVVGVTVLSTAWGDVPAPPVNQNIGMLDTVTGDLTEADCRVCHSSGVPDRHHVLYGQPLPDPTLVPYPGAGTTYVCLSCHDENFTVVRECTACHNQGSPHHSSQNPDNLTCSACHGDLVDDPGDGHYIPTYDPSLVTPWRGLNGDGYENAPYPTPDRESDGSGDVVPSDATVTEAGPPFFTVTDIGPLGTVHTRNEPAQIKIKPAGDNNDFFIGSTHHGGEGYSVVFNAGSPLAASWDDATQALSVTLDTTQTAQEVVDAINAATGSVDVAATLGYDGVTLLAPEHYEPLGGAPANSRGYGAGSCSYCHDTDGILDANGDPAGVIWDNHTTHHEIGMGGGFPARCNVCHDYATVGEQSGPNFDSAIRVCETCHGPESLHNIQADSDGDGSVVVGGELAGYGHVGRDAGPGDSDCWGCHGFGFEAAAVAPYAGPIIPTLYEAGLTSLRTGADTSVDLSGSGFTNTTKDQLYESDVVLTAHDGSTVTLSPDDMSQGLISVTFPGTLTPGNYNVQAVKDEVASNPAVISVVPKVEIADATASEGTVTINGSGFAGYAAGSGTAVKATDTGVEGSIVSWSQTAIEVQFASVPESVTVVSVFGTATSEVDGVVREPKFRRGDSNSDGTVDLSDAIHTLDYLFAGGQSVLCPDASDTNDSAEVDISDAVLTLNWLFGGVGELAPPGPAICGTDPTEDDLPDCQSDPVLCE